MNEVDSLVGQSLTPQINNKKDSTRPLHPSSSFSSLKLKLGSSSGPNFEFHESRFFSWTRRMAAAKGAEGAAARRHIKSTARVAVAH
jgi:hypothetical protein